MAVGEIDALGRASAKQMACRAAFHGGAVRGAFTMGADDETGAAASELERHGQAACDPWDPDQKQGSIDRADCMYLSKGPHAV